MRDQKDLRSREKEVRLDWKSGRKLIQNALKLLNNTFWWKIIPTLGPCISGNKCDRNKPFFSVERGGQSDCAEA